jgi:signal transduction histidine kinase
VAVCDNGPGLSEALTADLTARPNGRLGLAIGSHIAQAHGDGLRVLPGAGTRIGFTLLRAEASQALP